MKPVALLGPGSKLRGLQSDLALTEIGAGGFAIAENVRFRRQAAEVRKGATRRGSANPIAGGDLVGYKVLAGSSGVQHIYAAFRVGTETRCYACVSFTGGGWTEISDSATRFTGSRYRVGFTTAYSGHLSTFPNKVVFGNGVDDCRVIVGLATKAVHSATQAKPTSLSQTPLPYAWANYVGGFTITNSDAVKLKITASSAAALVLEVFAVAFGGTQTAKIQWATTTDYQRNAGNQRLPILSQVGLAYAIGTSSASSGLQFISKVTAEGYKNTATYIPITSSTNASPIVVTSAAHGRANGDRVYVLSSAGNTGAIGVWTLANVTANTFELAGSTGTGVGGAGSAQLLSDLVIYDVTNAAMSYAPPTQKTVERNTVGSTSERTRSSTYKETGLYLFDATHLAGYSAVNLTLHAASGPSSATTTVGITSIFSGGYVPGASIYAVSLANADSLSESVGAPCEEKYALVTQLGGCTTDTGAIYQAGLESFCAYLLRFAEISTANRDSYVLYRSEPTIDGDGNPGYTEFGYLTYGSLPSSNPFGVLTTKYNNTAEPNYAYLAKPDDHIPMPKTNVFGNVNGRIFAAKATDANLYVSRLNDPFSFSETGTVDVTGQVDFRSATKQSYDSGITGLLPMVGQLKGVNDLLSFTTSAVYRLGGFSVQDVARSTQASNIGTPFTDSICYVDGRVCYLTSEREFVDIKSGYSLNSLSVFRVNSRFQSANLGKVCATAVRGQVSIAVGEASGDTSNNVALVYDQKLDAWATDRFSGFTPAGLVSVNDAGVYRSFAITDNGELWELESGTTENAANIPVVLETGVFGPIDQELSFGRSMVVADSAAVTFTIERKPFGNPGGVSNVTAQAVSTATGYRNVMYDRSSGGSNAGCRAFGCRANISYTAAGGHLTYAWLMEVEDRNGRAKTNG